MVQDTTRMILVRHGQADPQGRFLQHACTGLDATGRRQARRLADRFVAAGLHVDAVITSRAARAEQTGRIVAEALGRSVDETTCDLCEMHPGRAEGLTPEEMRETFGPTYAQVPGAEHWPDWLPGAAARLQERGRRHEGQTILAFTHYGVIKASFYAYGRMPGTTAETVTTGNTGITEWTRPTDPKDPRHGIWCLRRHNDIGHLA